MNEDAFSKLAVNHSINDVIDSYMVQINGLLDDAENQAHNDCHLGVAVAVGRAKAAMVEMIAAWNAAKNN